MSMTASELRQNVYRIIDQVLETGVPVEIERAGRRVRLVPEETPSKLARLMPHPGTIVGDPEDLVHVEWSSEWQGLPT